MREGVLREVRGCLQLSEAKHRGVNSSVSLDVISVTRCVTSCQAVNTSQKMVGLLQIYYGGQISSFAVCAVLSS